jgi:hypothetical protein
MKFIFIFISVAFALSCNDSDHLHTRKNVEVEPIVIKKTDKAIPDTIKTSLPALINNKIGTAHFTIKYHSPAVRGRVIWGGLVPFGEVWVTGAHSATTIESDKDFIINNKNIPAGKYSFFTIPSKDAWTVIINKNWDQHLADEYQQADDVIRFEVKPDTLDHIQERLMYDINQWAQKEGDIIISWERLRLAIHVRVL